MFRWASFIVFLTIPFSRSFPALTTSGELRYSYVVNLHSICGGVSSIVKTASFCAFFTALLLVKA